MTTKPREQAAPVLIVGSMAFDDLELPSANEKNVVGGSATYAAYAAAVRLGRDIDRILDRMAVSRARPVSRRICIARQPAIETALPVGVVLMEKRFDGAIAGRSATVFTAAFNQTTGVGTYVAMESFEGTVDGRSLDFMVDTGATVVAVGPSKGSVWTG